MAAHQVGHTGGSGVHRQVGDVVVHGLAFQYGPPNPYALPIRWNQTMPACWMISVAVGLWLLVLSGWANGTVGDRRGVTGCVGRRTG